MDINDILGYKRHETATEEELLRYVDIVNEMKKAKQQNNPYENTWASDATDIYEKIGYLHIREDLYRFQEFKKDAVLGEFNKGCPKTKMKVHFAFKSEGLWYYVVLGLTSKEPGSKLDFARENNLNLIQISLIEALGEWCQFYKSRGNWIEYSERIGAIVCRMEMKEHWDISLLHKETVQADIVNIRDYARNK